MANLGRVSKVSGSGTVCLMGLIESCRYREAMYLSRKLTISLNIVADNKGGRGKLGRFNFTEILECRKSFLDNMTESLFRFLVCMEANTSIF